MISVWMGMGHPNPAGILDHRCDVRGVQRKPVSSLALCAVGQNPTCLYLSLLLLSVLIAAVRGISSRPGRDCKAAHTAMVLGVLPTPVCRRLHREAACVDCRLQQLRGV